MGKKRAKRTPKKLSVDVVEAQAIVLVDEFATVRAELSCGGGDGGVGGFTLFRLNGDDGRPRIELQVTAEGANIQIFNSDQSTAIGMAVNDDTGSGMCISGGHGLPHISIGVYGPQKKVPPGPGPRIDILDPQAKRAWSLDVLRGIVIEDC